MIKKKNLKPEENEQFKKAFEAGKQWAEQMYNKDPEKYEKMKGFLIKLMKGVENVNI